MRPGEEVQGEYQAKAKAPHNMSASKKNSLHRNAFILVLIVLTCLATAFTQQTSIPGTSQELDQLLISRDSGLLTDFRVVGPFGKTSDFNKIFGPERDQLRKRTYGNLFAINLQFATGKFELPLHAPKNGVFYASSEVWLPNSGEWRIYAETAGTMTIFLDGKPMLHRDSQHRDLQTTSQVVHVERGTHRVLVKFTATAAPFHLAVMPQTGGLRKRNNKPNIHLAAESEYTSAELHWPSIRR
jgi:hypothetical protein